ncbi:MAG: helix-turn-helix transcriptional regulator [Clostridia bacterium]|nr:helix-turn-helix transcriptional regulator [Clostridia bacterium]
MTVNEAVVLRIKQLLCEKNMSQYRLEQNSGIVHGSMQCIMNNRNKTITLSSVLRIAKGFGMTPSEFLNDEIFLSNEIELEKDMIK